MISEPSADVPRVSVLIPAFNHETYVGETLASIADQDYPNIEVILVDDGSSDGTLHAAQLAFKELNLNGQVLSQQNQGVVPTVHRALERSSGEYVVLFASDDMMVAGRISRQVAAMEQAPSLHILAGTSIKLFADGSKRVQHLRQALRAQKAHRLERLLFLRDDRGPLLQSALIRRSLFDLVGSYDEAFPPEDWWLLTRAVARKANISIADRPEVVYRLHAANTHAQPGRLMQGRLRVIKEHCPAHLQRRARANLFASLSRANVAHPTEAFRFLWRSLCTRPSASALLEFGRAAAAETRHRLRRRMA